MSGCRRLTFAFYKEIFFTSDAWREALGNAPVEPECFNHAKKTFRRTPFGNTVIIRICKTQQKMPLPKEKH